MQKDIAEKNRPTHALDPIVEAEHVPEKDLKSPQHFVTAGERKFDRVNYTGIGYIINALLSVVAVGAVERTHGGQRMIEKFGQWTGKTLNMNPARAKLVATKSFFLSGGFAVLVPMKLMEDAKTRLVKKWNHEIYGERADTDIQILQSQHELEQGPKQSWSSIFASRVLALVPFYITVGMLWDRQSVLSKATNPELHAMSKEAAATMEKESPAAFSQLASKGYYFDRPIATASRTIGKAYAKLTGNHEALAKLEKLQTEHPGIIRSVKDAEGAHDPAHSVVPYYFISEAITSAMVAWGVYVLTRVLGPIFDKREDHSMKPVPWQPSNSAIPITEPETRRVTHRETSAPETKIVAESAQHQAALEAQHAQERV